MQSAYVNQGSRKYVQLNERTFDNTQPQAYILAKGPTDLELACLMGMTMVVRLCHSEYTSLSCQLLALKRILPFKIPRKFLCSLIGRILNYWRGAGGFQVGVLVLRKMWDLPAGSGISGPGCEFMWNPLNHYNLMGVA